MWNVMDRLTDQVKHGPGLDSALEIWRRRKWVALLAFSAVFAGVVSVTLSLPDLYGASATVLVEGQQVSEAFVRPSVTSELETRIQTIHQEIMSRGRLTDVIARLGLYPDLTGHVPIDAVVERMRRDIKLDRTHVQQSYGRIGTIAFTLSYSGSDPGTVAQVVNTLAAFYVEENTKSRERQAARTAEFLKEQLAGVKHELDEKEQRASDFRLRHTGELPQQLEANLAALERFNTQLRLNVEYQIRGIERRDRLEEQLEEQVAEAGLGVRAAPPPGDTLAGELAKRRQQLAEMRRKFSDQHPDVIDVKAELDALEQQVPQQARAGNEEPAKTPAPADPAVRLRRILSQVDAELKGLKEQEEFLRQAVAGYEARLENAPKRHQEFQELSSDYDSTKQRYETLLKRYEEAQLAESLEQHQDVEQFRVLDPAIPPKAPMAPDRQRLLLMGLMLSLAFAFGAVMAAEKLDTSFHTVDDLRAFVDLPILATIRLIRTQTNVHRQQRRLALVTVLVMLGLAIIVLGAHYFATGNLLPPKMAAAANL